MLIKALASLVMSFPWVEAEEAVFVVFTAFAAAAVVAMTRIDDLKVTDAAPAAQSGGVYSPRGMGPSDGGDGMVVESAEGPAWQTRMEHALSATGLAGDAASSLDGGGGLLPEPWCHLT